MLKIKIDPKIGPQIVENAINDYDIISRIGSDGKKYKVISNPLYLRHFHEISNDPEASQHHEGSYPGFYAFGTDSGLDGSGSRATTLNIWFEGLNPFMHPVAKRVAPHDGGYGLISKHGSGANYGISPAKAKLWALRQYSIAYSGKPKNTGEAPVGLNASSGGRVTYITTGMGVAFLKLTPPLDNHGVTVLQPATTFKTKERGSCNALTHTGYDAVGSATAKPADFPANVRGGGVLGYYSDPNDHYDDERMYPSCKPFLVHPADTGSFGHVLDWSQCGRKGDTNVCTWSKTTVPISPGTGESHSLQCNGDYPYDGGSCSGDLGLADFKGHDSLNGSVTAGPVAVQAYPYVNHTIKDTATHIQLAACTRPYIYARVMLTSIATILAMVRMRRFFFESFWGAGETEENFWRWSGLATFSGGPGTGAVCSDVRFESVLHDNPDRKEWDVDGSVEVTSYNVLSGGIYAHRAGYVSNNYGLFDNSMDAFSAGTRGRGLSILGESQSEEKLMSDTDCPLGISRVFGYGYLFRALGWTGVLDVVFDENGGAWHVPELRQAAEDLSCSAAVMSVMGRPTTGNAFPIVRRIGKTGFDSSEYTTTEWYGNGLFSQGNLNAKIFVRGRLYNGN